MFGPALALSGDMVHDPPPRYSFRVPGVPGIRHGYYELSTCRFWQRKGNWYNYNLFRPGLRLPALKWSCDGSRRYLRSRVAWGKKLYSHRLAAFLLFRQRSRRRADFSSKLRDVHHRDFNLRNNRWQNLLWCTKRQHKLFRRGRWPGSCCRAGWQPYSPPAGVENSGRRG